MQSKETCPMCKATTKTVRAYSFVPGGKIDVIRCTECDWEKDLQLCKVTPMTPKDYEKSIEKIKQMWGC